MEHPMLAALAEMDQKEKQAAVDSGLVLAGSLAELKDRVALGGYYTYAMGTMREITHYSDSLWLHTGKSWERRSWCCHGGTNIYKKA